MLKTDVLTYLIADNPETDACYKLFNPKADACYKLHNPEANACYKLHNAGADACYKLFNPEADACYKLNYLLTYLQITLRMRIVTSYITN